MTADKTAGTERRIVLTTPRTVLTTWLDGDAEALLLLHSDAETMRFVRHGRPESREEVEELVTSYIAQQAVHGWTKWRLTDVDGQLIGRAGFGGTDEVRDISFLIARPLWGHGLAGEIATALVDWHLANAPHAILRAFVAEGNHASARVLRKIGFQAAGTEEREGSMCWKFMHPAS
jgi:RimJ/RimL family protein N-acetyltransferase